MRVKGVFRNMTLIMCLLGGGVFVFGTKRHFLSEEDASEGPVKPLQASLRWVATYVSSTGSSARRGSFGGGFISAATADPMCGRLLWGRLGRAGPGGVGY